MAANTSGPALPYPISISINLLFSPYDAVPTRRLESAE
jgi:hypothetical protein